MTVVRSLSHHVQFLTLRKGQLMPQRTGIVHTSSMRALQQVYGKMKLHEWVVLTSHRLHGRRGRWGRTGCATAQHPPSTLRTDSYLSSQWKMWSWERFFFSCPKVSELLESQTGDSETSSSISKVFTIVNLKVKLSNSDILLIYPFWNEYSGLDILGIYSITSMCEEQT